MAMTTTLSFQLYSRAQVPAARGAARGSARRSAYDAVETLWRRCSARAGELRSSRARPDGAERPMSARPRCASDRDGVVALQALGVETRSCRPSRRTSGRRTPPAGRRSARELGGMPARWPSRASSFAWHNHDFEFEALPDGSLPLDHILDGGAGVARGEADLAWIVRGGAGPGRLARSATGDRSSPSTSRTSPRPAEDRRGRLGRRRPRHDRLAGAAGRRSPTGALCAGGRARQAERRRALRPRARFDDRRTSSWRRSATMATLGRRHHRLRQHLATPTATAPLFASLEVVACADSSRRRPRRRPSITASRALTVDELLAEPDIDIVVNLTVPDAHFEVSHAVARGRQARLFREAAGADASRRRARSSPTADAAGCSSAARPTPSSAAAHQACRALIDEGAHRHAGRRHRLLHVATAWSTGTRTRTSSSSPAAGRCSTSGPTTSPRWSTCSGRCARVAAHATIGCAERTSPASRAAASASRSRRRPHVDGAARVRLRRAGARSATSWDVWQHGHLPIELYGTEGTLLVPDPNFFGGAVAALPPRRTHEPVDPGFARRPTASCRGPRRNYRIDRRSPTWRARSAAGRPHRARASWRCTCSR